jgi:hypothetical protein
MLQIRELMSVWAAYLYATLTDRGHAPPASFCDSGFCSYHEVYFLTELTPHISGKCPGTTRAYRSNREELIALRKMWPSSEKINKYKDVLWPNPPSSKLAL